MHFDPILKGPPTHDFILFCDFIGLQISKKRKFGRGEANVFEPTQLSLKRIYGVQWKKQALCLDELAKLYHDKGLTVTEISARLCVPRSTVHDAVLRLKSCAPINGGSK